MAGEEGSAGSAAWAAVRFLLFLALVAVPVVVAIRLFPITESRAGVAGPELGQLSFYWSVPREGVASRAPDVSVDRKPYGFDLRIDSAEYAGTQFPEVYISTTGEMTEALKRCDVITYSREPGDAGKFTEHRGPVVAAQLPPGVAIDENDELGTPPSPPVNPFTVRLSSAPKGATSVQLECHTPDALVSRDDGPNLYFYLPVMAIRAFGDVSSVDSTFRGSCIRASAGYPAPDATIVFEDPVANSVDGRLRTWSRCGSSSTDSVFLDPITAQYNSIEGARSEQRATFIAGVLLGAAVGAVPPALESGERLYSSLRAWRRNRLGGRVSARGDEVARPDPVTAEPVQAEPVPDDPARGIGETARAAILVLVIHVLRRRAGRR